MEKVLIYSGSRINIEMLSGILENNGIDYLIQSGYGLSTSVYPRGSLDILHLYVNEEDAEEAHNLCGFIDSECGKE